MKIKMGLFGWFAIMDNKKCDKTKQKTCDRCNTKLERWYIDIINTLKKKGLLGKDFEMLCCNCKMLNCK